MSFIRNIIRNNNIKSKKIELSNIRQFTNFIKVYEPALLSINYDKYFDEIEIKLNKFIEKTPNYKVRWNQLLFYSEFKPEYFSFENKDINFKESVRELYFRYMNGMRNGLITKKYNNENNENKENNIKTCNELKEMFNYELKKRGLDNKYKVNDYCNEIHNNPYLYITLK